MQSSDCTEQYPKLWSNFQYQLNLVTVSDSLSLNCYFFKEQIKDPPIDTPYFNHKPANAIYIGP